MNPSEYDLSIIGSGPAGIAAAITARKYGLRVLVLMNNLKLGGKYSVTLRVWRKTLILN